MLIAQITDTHIVAKGEHWLGEPATKTSERLQKAITFINQMNPLPDVVLLTGDASDSGSQASYYHLREILDELRPPLYIIPGNHDSREELRRSFENHSYMPKEGFIQYRINDFPLSLIGLDTVIKGTDAGEICETRFAWLKKAMQADDKPKLIFMHHPPVKIGYKVFDSINCAVPIDFERSLSSQNKLLGIVTGHYHHFFLAAYANKPCFMAPSVAPVHYFANPEDDHVTALELREPSITLHKWHGEKLISQFIRIKDDYLRIDWGSIKENLN